jgi:hypothetical protein
MAKAGVKKAGAKAPAKKGAAKKGAANKAAANKAAANKRAANMGAANMGAANKPTAGAASAAALLDARIEELGGWRGETLSRIRRLIHEAVPGVLETWKWMGVPVFEHAGILCTGETYKAAVKTTFARGASLPDPKRLFNASLEGGTRRAIDFREGEAIDEEAFRELVRAAAELNAAKA